jgi:hypothetical protein
MKETTMNHAVQHLTPAERIHMALAAPDPSDTVEIIANKIIGNSGWSQSYVEAYQLAEQTAARIVAERATVPSDEATDDELGHIAYRAMLQGEFIPWDQFRNGGWHDLAKTTADDYIRIGCAVRAAVQPGPVMPEGWALDCLERYSFQDGDRYVCVITKQVSEDDFAEVEGQDDTWQEALASAITAAEARS